MLELKELRVSIRLVERRHSMVECRCNYGWVWTEILPLSRKEEKYLEIKGYGFCKECGTEAFKAVFKKKDKVPWWMENERGDML